MEGRKEEHGLDLMDECRNLKDDIQNLTQAAERKASRGGVFNLAERSQNDQNN